MSDYQYYNVPFEICRIEQHAITVSAESKEDAYDQVMDMYGNGEFTLNSTEPEDIDIHENRIEKEYEEQGYFS